MSRRTLRAALAQLEQQGLVKSGQGRRRRLLRRAGRMPPASSSNTVVLLSFEPVAILPRFSIFWMDELRQHLSAAGYQLQVHLLRSYPERRPAQALEQLAQREGPAAWVLASCTAPVQHWFSHQGLPCLIVGSRHEGVALPSVDINYRALCRHAAGLLLARGRSPLAFLNPRSGLAGDLESELGFKEAANQFQRQGGEVIIAHHDDTRQGVCERLKALLRRKTPPTGLLVSRASHVMLALCFLLQRGLRLPQDVAIISRDDDVFLQYALPSVACYSASPELLARKVCRVVLQLANGGISEPRDYRVMPRFVPGDTLG